MGHFQVIGRALRSFGRSAAALSRVLMILSPLLLVGCQSPDPKTVLKVTDVETYWVLDPSRTEKKYLAPAVRFRVENISDQTFLAVDANASFKIVGKDDPWGSGFFRLTEGRKTLPPGTKVLVTMSSDARYTTEGDVETAFSNPTFKPVTVAFFLKIGSSTWAEFGKQAVENVIGSKDARALLAQPK
jgi:hypothetical protein